MKRQLAGLAVAALVLGGTALAARNARASGPSVAVIPAVVVKGNPDNSGPITAAVKAELEKAGYTVVDEAKVESALKQTSFNPKAMPTTKTLGAVRSAAGADFALIPRVLSVGIGVNAQRFQANILLNVQGKNTSSFAYTRQVGQVFKSEATKPEEAVIGDSEAATAAHKLLANFKKK